MRPETRDRLDQFFAENFELPPAELSNDRVLVRRHPRIFEGYAGAYLLHNTHGYLLTVPPNMVASVNAAVERIPPASLFDVDALCAVFGDAVDVPIGPSTVAYADDTDFCPADTLSARLLTREDADAMIRFREACDPLEWNHGGSINAVQHPTFAVFIDDAIVAAASYEYQGEWIRHVGVISHPQHRGRGFGTAVASAVTAHGLDEGGIMQWQTLNANVPSFRIGQALGYQPWVETLAVRLRI
jgi:GNAT superfamily N-acetyltransferase